MGTIRTTYHWIAALALLHLLALGAGVGYLFGTGKLDAQRVRAAVGVLWGEQEQITEAEPVEPAVDQVVHHRQQGMVNDEIERRTAERYRTQVEQRLKFVNAARLEVDRRREEFEAQVEKDRQARKLRAERESVAGYAKEIEIIAALSPKTALEQIMTMDDAEAARVMFQLDTRKVKKIIEAAKTDVDRARITIVRRLIRDMRPTEAQEPRR
ncbi:MAG: hypothetical protein V3W34_17155 [Phycisphaerae bacterium]